MVRTAIIVAFCPVVDVKLEKFLKGQRGLGCDMWVLAPELVRKCCAEMEHCEALNAATVVVVVELWKFFRSAQTANWKMLKALRQRDVDIIMPDTPVSHAVANAHLQGCRVTFAPLPQIEGV